jgi:hypothetical protein
MSATRNADMGRIPLKGGFRLPSSDLAQVLGSLGIALFSRERTLVQYVAWSIDVGLLEVVHQRGAVSSEEVATLTELTVSGAESFLGVLSALDLVRRSVEGRYSLAAAAEDYFIRESPFFIGNQLKSFGYPIPGPYLRGRAKLLSRLKLRLLRCLPMFRYGTPPRLENQHARNLTACAAAVRAGHFANVSCIVDIAGGSGAFAIPLVLEYPHKRVILTELPQALPNIRPILAASGVQNLVELRAMDVLQFPWRIPKCDGIFIGNFVHGFNDEIALRICQEAFRTLDDGGMVWLHEMLWNESRDGPLLTALWHAAMKSAGEGGQRRGSEWEALLTKAGFIETQVIGTHSSFALVVGRKPAAGRELRAERCDG